jgi:hypothetical protein
MSKPIKNISEFLEQLKEIKKEKDGIELFYRGESQDFGETKNTPGIYRNQKLIEKEHELFRDFILRNPDEFKNEKTTFEKLVKMQHYGLPTRILDVTSNALISLYFACENDSDKNGFVYIFEVPKEEIKFYDSDTVSILANLSKLDFEEFDKVDIQGTNSKYINSLFNEVIKRGLFKFLSNQEVLDRSLGFYFKRNDNNHNKNFDSELLFKEHINLNSNFAKDTINEIGIFKIIASFSKKDNVNFENRIDYKDLLKTILVKPVLSNRRVIMQSGAFLVFGIRGNKLSPSGIELKTNQIEIDSNSKEDILKELETLGISKDRIYPEMDKVAEYLKEKVLK